MNSTTLTILVPGYVFTKNRVEYASSTVTLVRSRGHNIIVDPGHDWPRLKRALAKVKLQPDQIDFVVLTHTHPDHALLAGIFLPAPVIDGECIYNYDGQIKNHDAKIPGSDIKIIKTPGHSKNHCSIIIKNEIGERVLIAGDLFWWEDTHTPPKTRAELLNLPDVYALNRRDLLDSRRQILKQVDIIIPGHGKMIKLAGLK